MTRTRSLRQKAPTRPRMRPSRPKITALRRGVSEIGLPSVAWAIRSIPAPDGRVRLDLAGGRLEFRQLLAEVGLFSTDEPLSASGNAFNFSRRLARSFSWATVASTVAVLRRGNVLVGLRHRVGDAACAGSPN